MAMEAELDWLFNEVELRQPGPHNKNIKNHHDTLLELKVLLYATIKSSTNNPNDSPSVALKEEGDGAMHAEMGPCHGPNSFLRPRREEAKAYWPY